MSKRLNCGHLEQFRNGANVGERVGVEEIFRRKLSVTTDPVRVAEIPSDGEELSVTTKFYKLKFML